MAYLGILALLDSVSRTTVMVQVSVIRPSIIRTLTQVCQKPQHGSKPNFVEIFTIFFRFH